MTPVSSHLVTYALGSQFNFTPPNTTAPCGNNPKVKLTALAQNFGQLHAFNRDFLAKLVNFGPTLCILLLPQCCGCAFITNHTCAGPPNGTCNMPHHQPTDDRGFYSLGGSSCGPGLVPPQQNRLAPGNSSVITAQSVVITGDLLASSMN